MLNALEIEKTILNLAEKNNCEAQVTIVQTDSKDINVRKGKIENLLSSTTFSTGVRLFRDKKSTIISFSGDNFKNVELKIKTGLESIDCLSKDDSKRLLTGGEFGEEIKKVELDDSHYDSIKIGEVAEILKSIEADALAVSEKMIPSEMAGFSQSRTRIYLYSSRGLAKSYSKSYYSFTYNAVAESNGMKEVGYWYESKRFFKELSDPEIIGNIGQRAAERALKRLGGKKIKSGERPVIFSFRTASSLLRLLFNALNGRDILIRNSFLVDKLGEKLFPEKITIIDDPLIDRYPGSYPFDGEGMNGKTKTVIDKGTLSTYLHNSYSASKLNMALTGNASHSLGTAPGIASGNFYLKPGSGNMEDLVQEMKNGLLVDDLFLSGVNKVTGDFSFGCSGFLVEKGDTANPIKEITIAGNVLELFKNVVEIANDNEYKKAFSSPSILVSKLAIAGI